ncbi:MAG: excinuclease ABC subunit UvrC [Candidatus Izemoplasmatales bacterium]|jgi:excinuclease ABC subunit C|nr:excinuclease ABC subunit UvrC [Candidatus Izemoplasmatales bacterium]
MNPTIQAKLANLPEQPGSYQMLDQFNTIIYVGKAKNLKNRVRSYFMGTHDLKTTKLVSNIVDFTYIVTKTEIEGFLLELSLIKEHTPKYNIMLMDDKTYPYIEITNETHPKLQITRRVSKKNKNVFGPFPNASAARDTLDLLHRLFPLRKCQPMPKRLCLYYHIGQCLGPCVYPITELNYQPIIQQIKHFFKGQNTEIIEDLKRKMLNFSARLEFEKAQEMKQLIQAVQDTTSKQQVIFHDLIDRDIFHYASSDTHMAITMLFMRQGKIIFSESKLFAIYQSSEDAFIDFIAQFYQKQPIPKEIFLPLEIDVSTLQEVVEHAIVQPIRGAKKELLEMAKQNAQIYLANHIDIYLKKEAKMVDALASLSELSGVEGIRRMECFDNSHTQGSNQVSAMVVFVNGAPEKKSYRKFAVKYAKKADDIGTMKEILYRRYQKMLETNSIDRPDLIIMDGGINQVHAAKEVLASLYLDIPVVGLKKDSFHKTDVFIQPEETEVKLSRHTPLYVLLSRIQEEAHRFAISFHREKQSKQIYASILDAIPLIGKTTKQRLLEQFKTIQNIKAATDIQLKELSLKKPQIENLRIALQAYED